MPYDAQPADCAKNPIDPEHYCDDALEDPSIEGALARLKEIYDAYSYVEEKVMSPYQFDIFNRHYGVINTTEDCSGPDNGCFGREAYNIYV